MQLSPCKVLQSITTTYKSFVQPSISTYDRHGPPLLSTVTAIFVVLKVVRQLVKVATMGIADPPCSGYIRDGGMTCVLVIVLCLALLEQQRGVLENGSTQRRVPIVGTAQIDHHRSNDACRRAATTSTIPRARSGWSGFSEFTIRLPGPLGKVLGRC